MSYSCRNYFLLVKIIISVGSGWAGSGQVRSSRLLDKLEIRLMSKVFSLGNDVLEPNSFPVKIYEGQTNVG